MKTLAFAALTLALATPVLAQTPPARSSDLTRSLNGAPPAATGTADRPVPAPAPAAVAPSTTRTPPAARPTAAPVPAPRSVPAPPATNTSTTPTPTPVPTATPTPVLPTAPAPAATVLNAAAVAALPFTLELPAGFQIVTGRPGPDFRVYTVRRGDTPFVMIYAGPSSQFPIYDGEMAVAGGRTSVVVMEGGQRRAMEHLFTSPAAPREIHVWVSSLDGADRALGERIAQSVDAR